MVHLTIHIHSFGSPRDLVHLVHLDFMFPVNLDFILLVHLDFIVHTSGSSRLSTYLLGNDEKQKNESYKEDWMSR